MSLAKLLGFKRLKPSQLVPHIARTKKTMRDARALVLKQRETPTPETAAEVLDVTEKLLILLAGADPKTDALADISFDEKK